MEMELKMAKLELENVRSFAIKFGKRTKVKTAAETDGRAEGIWGKNWIGETATRNYDQRRGSFKRIIN